MIVKEFNLEKADFIGSNLKGSDLQEINLQETNLVGANFTEANLQGSDLEKLNLRR